MLILITWMKEHRKNTAIHPNSELYLFDDNSYNLLEGVDYREATRGDLEKLLK